MTSIRILGFAALLCLVSCQKEISTDSTEKPVSSLDGSLQMKIDGETWTADNTVGAFLMNGMLNISAIGSDKKYFTITLTSDVPGTYELSQTALHVAALVDSNSNNRYAFTTNQSDDLNLASGTVVITKIDAQKGTVSGTFQLKMFRMMDNAQMVITDGVFEDVKYLTSIPPTATTDTLEAYIDNVPWKAKVVTGTVFQDQLFLSGSETNGIKSLAVVMPLNVEPGEYEFETFGEYTALHNPEMNVSLGSESGKLTIIEHNKSAKRIRGQFEFVGTELLGTKSATITQGVFAITYK